MPRGPLPNPNRRRRNAPEIPTTELPVDGRKGRAPAVPKWVKLGTAGRAFWSWAWKTPQAAAWGESFAPLIARRAALEDDLASIGQVKGHRLDDLLAAESASEVRALIARVASLASGRLQILKEMRELDDRCGLTPKGMAALRWRIIGQAEQVPLDDEVTRRRQERRRRIVSEDVG